MRECVRPSVRRLVRRSVGRSVRNALVSAGRDVTANDLFRVYELVLLEMCRDLQLPGHLLCPSRGNQFWGFEVTHRDLRDRANIICSPSITSVDNW